MSEWLLKIKEGFRHEGGKWGKRWKIFSIYALAPNKKEKVIFPEGGNQVLKR